MNIEHVCLGTHLTKKSAAGTPMRNRFRLPDVLEQKIDGLKQTCHLTVCGDGADLVAVFLQKHLEVADGQIVDEFGLLVRAAQRPAERQQNLHVPVAQVTLEQHFPDGGIGAEQLVGVDLVIAGDDLVQGAAVFGEEQVIEDLGIGEGVQRKDLPGVGVDLPAAAQLGQIRGQCPAVSLQIAHACQRHQLVGVLEIEIDGGTVEACGLGDPADGDMLDAFKIDDVPGAAQKGGDDFGALLFGVFISSHGITALFLRKSLSLSVFGITLLYRIIPKMQQDKFENTEYKRVKTAETEKNTPERRLKGVRGSKSGSVSDRKQEGTQRMHPGHLRIGLGGALLGSELLQHLFKVAEHQIVGDPDLGVGQTDLIGQRAHQMQIPVLQIAVQQQIRHAGIGGMAAGEMVVPGQRLAQRQGMGLEKQMEKNLRMCKGQLSEDRPGVAVALPGIGAAGEIVGETSEVILQISDAGQCHQFVDIFKI